jgi:3'-phosphoadenosine 5'-phosphosulfate sulfotransferase (PAPS reductase)/FAD synthetase
MKSEIHVIANSGGRSSAYMTERLLKENEQPYIITFQNTGKEREETLEFIRACELRWIELYKTPIVWLEYNPDLPKKFEVVDFISAHRTSGDPRVSPFEKLIKKRGWLPNRVARTCTTELKIRTAKRYILSLGYKYWTSIVGIRFDEPKRWEKMQGVKSRERWVVDHPMVRWRTTKQDVNDFWKDMPFDLRLKPYEGNCDLCFLKGLGKKRQIIRENPSSADWWVKMEEEKGNTFREEYSYKEIVDGMAKAPEFEFRDDYECDIPCFCSID